MHLQQHNNIRVVFHYCYKQITINPFPLYQRDKQLQTRSMKYKQCLSEVLWFKNENEKNSVLMNQKIIHYVYYKKYEQEKA